MKVIPSSFGFFSRFMILLFIDTAGCKWFSAGSGEKIVVVDFSGEMSSCLSSRYA